MEAGVSSSQLALSTILIAGLLTIEIGQGSDDPRDYLVGRPAWVGWLAYYALAAIALTVGVFAQSPFIYFQF